MRLAFRGMMKEWKKILSVSIAASISNWHAGRRRAA